MQQQRSIPAIGKDCFFLSPCRERGYSMDLSKFIL